MVGIFTTYMAIAPISGKTEGGVASGFFECIYRMGRKPEVIYSDNESSLSFILVQKYFKDNNII